MKILLATDGSEYSNAAVEALAEKPYPEGTEVCVISVYETTSLITGIPVEAGALGGIWEEAVAAAQKSASRIVEKAAHILKESRPEWSISTTITEGSPKYEILQEAEKFGADLIVVGSHGRRAIERFLLGSVSQAIALHAKCSVEIVRAPIVQ